ncbi:MAG: D-aminopeptidase [Anaerolineales bacterium]|nr:D-aminopeptidase [Anaerolineales bacterium]
MNKPFQELTSRIQKEMKRLRVPGVAVGVWHRGREHSAGFGVTSVENPLPVTPETLFQTGSISKTYTATILMQLVEQGKLDLDEPVRKYLPELKLSDESVAEQVTTRNLLTHTGGWVGDYFNDFGNGSDANERMVKDIARLPQIQPLGKIWSYNNTGFNIAARLIEVLTGKPYEIAAQEMLFDPLGLGMTFFYPSDIFFTHRFVVGHHREHGRMLVSRPWAIGRAGNGVGGVISNVNELLKYARFHMGDGKSENGRRVIARKSLKAMRVAQINAGGRGEMCITWFRNEIGGVTRFGHGGATHGQQAYFFFVPEKDFALAILTNADEGGIITANAIGWAHELYFGVKTKAPKHIELKKSELGQYVGRYQIGTECFDLKIKNGMLVLQNIPLGGFPTPDTPPGPALPPMRFAFYEKEKLVGLDEPGKGAIADVIRGADGRVEFFRVFGRAHKKIA